jgi:hypothetical protein
MKKLIQMSGLLSAILLLSGNVFKTLHLAGAIFLITSAVIIFVTLFLPLLIAQNLSKTKNTVDKVRLTLANLLSMIAVTGILFKLMHWPYATMIMLISIGIFIFGYIPFYYLSKIKKSNLFDTTVNTVFMMMFGGMLYTLFDLSSI